MPFEFPRLLVVDASILFSFFKKDSSRRYLIEELPNCGCRLISPDFALEELLENKERIMEFAGIQKSGFMFLFSLLERKIETSPKSECEEFLPKAYQSPISSRNSFARKILISLNFFNSSR